MYTQNKVMNLSYKPKVNLSDNFSAIDFFFQLEGIENSLEEIIKRCYSILYEDGRLLSAFYLNLVEYNGIGLEDCCWFYIEEDETNFIKEACVYYSYGWGRDVRECYISEVQNFHFTKIAIEKFCEIHPEWQSFLKNIVSSWKPKYV